MIINIRLTEAAVEYVAGRAGLDMESAEELAQEVISLCDKSGTPSPVNEVIDERLDRLTELAAEKGSTLYEICFRRAGVGLLWWEEKRAGDPPVFPIGSINPFRLSRYNREMGEYTRRGLVVYRYYSSMGEALDMEEKRLKEMEA
jgi:hypothetical protein